MPTNYTHYRFGKEILPELPASVRQSIQRFRRLYDMGLHGPDLFFYHNPFQKTAAGSLGKVFHAQTGAEFFTQACSRATTEAARVYLYGVLTHYCLDSLTHPFVKKQVEAEKARHVEMEIEFDRYLLEQDGLVPPHTQDFSRHMKLTRGECVTVAEIYGAAPGAVLRADRFMILATRLMAGKHRKKVEKLLQKAGGALADNLMPEEPNQRCQELNPGMMAYYLRAKQRYPQMLQQLLAHMADGTPLGEEFDAIFG